MEAFRIAAALALLSAISPSSDGPDDRSTGFLKQDGREPSSQAASGATAPVGLEGYPTTQPDGSPLTAAYCLRVGDEPNNTFDNAKTCLMVACEGGDRASCELAATYNGNISQD